MKIITVTSGKGGVGKTNIAVNIAIRLSRKGYKTCLFDADLGLANINILMGIVTEKTLEDVIMDNVPLADIIIKDWNGIDIIPGSTGIDKMESLSPEDLDNVLEQFASIDNYDYFICDTAAGISKNVLAFCMAASLVLVPILPEPTSLTDSYSLLKVLSRKGYKSSPSIIVNRSKSEQFGEKLYGKFKETTEKFLPLKLSYYGSIQEDPRVTDSVAMQIPFIINAPDTPAARGITTIVENIEKHSDKNDDSMPGHFFKDFGHALKNNVKRQPKAGKDQTIQTKPNKNADSGSLLADKEFQIMVVSILKTLTDNSSMIIDELTRIREVLNRSGEAALPPDNAAVQPEQLSDDDPDEPDDNTPPVLSLNFEQYVREKKQKS